MSSYKKIISKDVKEATANRYVFRIVDVTGREHIYKTEDYLCRHGGLVNILEYLHSLREYHCEKDAVVFSDYVVSFTLLNKEEFTIKYEDIQFERARMKKNIFGKEVIDYVIKDRECLII